MKKNHSCKNCYNKKLTKLFSLGNLNYSGKFPKNKSFKIPKNFITLAKCNKCHLVQLDRKFDPKYLYNLDYGYRSGINKTMTNHLSAITKKLSSLVNLKQKDYVLDIASNDGTLLNSYKKKKIIKVGIDPIIKKFNKYYKNIDIKIDSFFSIKKFPKKVLRNKFKIISACAVFYDVENPNLFLKQISEILDEKQGIFYLEFQDLLSIIKNNLFDTICHEHLEYYSLEVIIGMLNKNNLKLLDLSNNTINGGSLSLIIGHSDSTYSVKRKKILKALNAEKRFNLNKISTYKKFYSNILQIKKKLKKIIFNILDQSKVIHGYGASTKGNILLQFFKVNNNQILNIADRNPEKVNLYTPGTKIKIISEKLSRLKRPDYYLVLPWHFKKEILVREKNIRKKGTKFIFPLPKLEIL